MQITPQLLRASWRSWYGQDLQRVGPAWLQLVWTVVFATGVGLGFTVLGVLTHGDWADPARWWRWFRVNFVIALAVALTIHALFAVTIRWLTHQRIRSLSNGRRAIFFTAVPMLGVCLGWPLGVWLVSSDAAGWVRISPSQAVSSAALAVLISSIIYLFFNSSARRLEAEKRATEAQLRLLQAQIEPHFLFNTLANVESLLDHDLPKARQMLSAFTDYLRASLGTLRQQESPLAQELELARSYLLLLQARMGERLRFSIEADAAAERVPVPPLLLQPLVENAVVHGLEPAIDGGTLQLRASVQGRQLVLEVQDDGRGLDAPPRLGARRGAGMALDNIRQRLLTRYGPEATLVLQALQPGTLARITLPLDEDHHA
jgi:glucose-6-phosphate-specific signal transduction histidine kinase